MHRFLAALLLCVIGCSHPALKDPKQALRRTSAPELADDLPLEPLLAAIETEIAFLEKAANHETLQFGERSYTKAEYLGGLRHFVDLARRLTVREEFFKAVKEDFDFYEVYGDKAWGEAFVTSYYQPIIAGSLKPTERFSRPLYKAPEDLVTLDLAAFDATKYALDRKLRGRLVDKKLVPYFNREEIDVKKALKGRKLELVWVDPIDSFMIQIQGSGLVELEAEKISGKQGPRKPKTPPRTSMWIAYAEKNGQPYEPLGKFVREFIPKEQLSLQAIENYVRSLPSEKMQEYLNKNPSYVFFKDSLVLPETHLGVPPTDGRTAAVDQRFFPKGALAFLVMQKPKFDSPTAFVPTAWEPLQRFVLDQDIGGAITGGGRLDLFWGTGNEAKRNAGVIKQTGKLYYLAPKVK